MSDKNTKTENIKYDIELIKEGFNQWVDKWKYSLLEEEFNSEFLHPHERGSVTKIEDDDSLKYRFITEFNFTIKNLKKEDEEETEDEETKGNK